MPADLNATPISPASVSGKLLWLDAADVDGDGQADSLATIRRYPCGRISPEMILTPRNPLLPINRCINRTTVDTRHSGLVITGSTLPQSNITVKHIFVATKVTSTSDNYMAILSRGGDRGRYGLKTGTPDI